MLFIQDKNLRIKKYNTAAAKVFSSTEEHILDKRCYEIIGQTEMCELCATERALKTKSLSVIEKYVPTLNMYLDCRSNPVMDEKGEIIHIVEQLRDITEKKKMEESLYLEKELFKTTLLSVGDAVISTDKQGRIVIMNDIAQRLTEWTLKEAQGKKLEEVLNIYHETTKEPCESPADIVLKTGEIIELAEDTLLISKKGKLVPIEDSAAPIIDSEKKVRGVVIVFRDVSEKREKLKEIEYLSFHDQLTGVYNRRFFEEELKRLDNGRNLPLSLIMIDVNGLKLINDAFGHRAGDTLLIEVAQSILEHCRKGDIIARIGGDEFVILLPQTDEIDATFIVQRILNGLGHKKVEVMPISVACGLATKTDPEEPITLTFSKAEDYMYHNKAYERKSFRHASIEIILKTLYEKIPREEEHARRVAIISEYLAKKMGLSNEMVKEVSTAALLHDIGKIAVSNDILNKVGVLTEDEWIEVKRHPEISYNILSAVNEYGPLAEIVLSHHERVDGKGYPRNLKDIQIPIQAKIISVADAFDAMASYRPYRKPLSIEKAMAELVNGKGTQFDSDVVDAFIELDLKFYDQP